MKNMLVADADQRRIVAPLPGHIGGSSCVDGAASDSNDIALGPEDLVCREICVNRSLPAHQHAAYLIAFVLAGCGQHEDACGRLPILAGDVCVVLPGQWHGYSRVHGTLSVFNLAISRAFLAACAPFLGDVPWLGSLSAGDDQFPINSLQRANVRLSALERRRVWPLLTALRDELGEQASYPRPGVRAGLVLQILGLLDRGGANAAHSTEDGGDGGDRGFLAAIRYLDERYVGPVSIKELAEITGYTPTSLTRKFRQRLGMSPSDYLLNLRIQRACALLAETCLSVASVASAVGFNDSHYFAARFHQVMGVTPSAFRLHTETDS